MNTWLAGSLIIGLSLIGQLILSWWIVIPICLIISYFAFKRSGKAFLVCFIALFVLWAGYALFIDLSNQQILSSRMGELFGGLPSLALVLVTGLLGGITGGLSGWLGTSLGTMINRK